MKYLVEIDSDKEKGAQLIKYIDELNADEDAVHILNEPPLTDEEMIAPGPRPSKARLEAWLEPKEDEEEFSLEESLVYIKQRMKELRNTEKENGGKNKKEGK